MLSFEISDMSDHGPQHSTPVKESFLSKIQRAENYKHPHKTGRVAALSDVKVNHAPHRHSECELLHHVDDHNDTSSKSGFLDSIIDISKISEIQNVSVHGNDISDTAHDDDNVTISSNHDLDCTATHSSLHTKQTPVHQNHHASIHNSSPTSISFKQGKLERGNPFNRHDAVRNVHAGTQYSRPLPSDCFSDSDLSKQSSSPRTTLSYMKVALSPSSQRMVKYRRVRSSSFPRSLLADANVCNSIDYKLPGCSISDFRRSPAVYIEQDIISKQRQEIQLLMEELGNRDQELNDLVMSHQKQVKAWESDNEKLVALQGRLSHYEEELTIRENQLKETLSEMSRVTEQREVDAVELKRTQNEMIKLAERIMENSVYIKEMEAQNQKLSFSLRDFVTARQSFSAREQELLLLLEEKDMALAERQQEIEKMVEHIKYLECQCEQLGERNNNTVVESVNWKKKYCQVKEEADRLNAECRLKEDNVQKMTQQLHESLQQAIALQKALFTSCEREKCKEEVMYSLRKQHKRTMQELQNIRELYDRLSRDTTLYHLSVKEKDSAKDVKKKDDLDGLSKKCKGDNPKYDEEADKRRQSGSRRYDANSKPKHPDTSEQSFLVKETKERRQTKDEKSGEKSTSKASEKNVVEQKISKIDGSRSYKSKADETEGYISKLESIGQITPQTLMERNIAKVLKNEPQVSTPVKSCHTTMCRNAATITSSTSLFSEEVNAQRLRARKCGVRTKPSMGDSKCSETEAAGHENTSKNADFKDTRSLTSSHNSTGKTVQSRTTSPFTMQAAPNKHDASTIERPIDVEGDSSSDASNIVSPSRFDDELTPADSDGMCNELQRDISRVQHLDRLSPMLEASGYESRSSRTPSNSLVAPKKSSFLKKDKTEKKESAAALKHNTKKRSVEFDAADDLSKSVSAETHSLYLAPESESYSPPTAERRPCIVTRGHVYPNTQQYGGPNCQSNKQSPRGREEIGPQHGSEASNMKSHPPDNVYFQGRGRCLHDTNEPEPKQEINSEYGHKNSLGSALLRQKGQMEENNASQWSLGSCSQCKAQGKAYCNCSIPQRTHPAFANQTTGNYEGDLSKNDVRYSCHGGLASATSKLTFSEIDSLLEYNSSLNKYQNRQLQSVDKGRMQVCSSPDEVNSAAFHHSDQKPHAGMLDEEPVHDQNVLIMSHKISCQDLPERITTYLNNHSSIRREMYNNNNNTCTDNIMNCDPCSCSQICKHEQKTQLQDGNLVACVDYIFDDNQGDSLPDSLLMPSDTEDVPDYGILNDKKNIKEQYRPQETCFNNVQVENVFQEAAGKKKKGEMNLNICLLASSGFESKDAINSDPVVGSSKLRDNKPVSELILHTGTTDCRPECLSCHAATKLVTESHLHPKDLVLNSRDERLCKSNCDMTGKQTVGFSKAASAPACSVSASTREPSLYKHLSLIHFSEATRRYEWVRHPALLEHKMQGENLHVTKSRGYNSTKNKLSDFKSCNVIHAVGSQPQDSILPDITDSRSDSQSSDSGHYSLSVASTDHSPHLGKPVDYDDHRSEIDSSGAYKSHTDQITRSPITSNKTTNNNSEQYNDPSNKNSNNNIICDVSHLKWSPTEIFTPPHSYVKIFDDVVKKLDFSDTFLEDSRDKRDSLVMSLPCQHCSPAYDKRDGMIQDRIASKILPAATDIYCDNNQCPCLSKEGSRVHAWSSFTHGSPEYIDPGGIVGCHDHNIQSLMSLSFADPDDELQVESEACADVTENQHCLDYSLDDANVKEMKEKACSSQKGRNMNKQKESNEKDIEGNEAYSEEDIHEVSNLSALAEEDLEEINSSHRQFYWAKNKIISHLNQHILVPEEDCCNNVETIYDPKTQWHAEKNQEILHGTGVGQPNMQHYNKVFHQPIEGILDNTRGSNGSVYFQARDASDASVWEFEDSVTRGSNESVSSQARDTAGASVWEFEDFVEELAEKCDDTLSAALDVSTESDESFTGTALSPVSRLYRLLVESQEMINSLEKNSSGPEAVDLEGLTGQSQTILQLQRVKSQAAMLESRFVAAMLENILPQLTEYAPAYFTEMVCLILHEMSPASARNGLDNIAC